MIDSSDNKRLVPITALRKRYYALKSGDKNTVAAHIVECERLLVDEHPLVDDFCAAVLEWGLYDLRDEGFYPPGSDRSIPKRHGTSSVLDSLERAGTISLSADPDYSFEYVNREISPRRTPNGKFPDGKPATSSGRGGIDYIAITHGTSARPVLGEVKVESDENPFYAFVQLLTYLSELSSEAQTIRASRFLFQNRIAPPAVWDLHILLADFNDLSQRHPLIEATGALVAKFKAALASRMAQVPLGRVWCLRMDTSTFNGSLDRTWVV